MVREHLNQLATSDLLAFIDETMADQKLQHWQSHYNCCESCQEYVQQHNEKVPAPEDDDELAANFEQWVEFYAPREEQLFTSLMQQISYSNSICVV